MGELTNYLLSKYLKTSTEDSSEANRVLIRGTIEKVCSENLKEIGDIFTFEVLESDLPYAVSVIDEEPLRSKYVINQVSKTLFEATIKEVDL